MIVAPQELNVTLARGLCDYSILMVIQMTELHAKTLADLCDLRLDGDEYILKDNIRKWIIAKIKNCKNDVYIDLIGTMDCSFRKRCQSCTDRMKDYGITEEMLNE